MCVVVVRAAFSYCFCLSHTKCKALFSCVCFVVVAGRNKKQRGAAMLVLLALLGASITSSSPALPQYAPNKLSTLPALPKPHHSWPLPAGIAQTQPQVYLDFVRITHSAPLDVLYSTQSDVESAVEACASAMASGTPASVAVNFSPWTVDLGWPTGTAPTVEGSLESTAMQLYNIRATNVSQWLQQANSAHQTNVSVGVVMIDSESFELNESQPFDSPWNSAITRKHNLVYNATVAAFPDAVVEWYSRGAVIRSSSPTGWSQTTLFTLEEQGSTFGVSLYSVADLGYTRESFNRTNNLATAAGPAGAGGTTPWIALGCGYRRNFSSTVFDFQWDYDRMASWQLGAEINNDWFGQQPERFASWTAAKRVLMYPSIFDTRSPAVQGPDGPSTAMMEHFVAYVYGAAMVELLPNSSRVCSEPTLR